MSDKIRYSHSSTIKLKCSAENAIIFDVPPVTIQSFKSGFILTGEELVKVVFTTPPNEPTP